MTGLVLALALAVGQQCPNGSCDPIVRTRVESPPPPVATSWHDYCVRVIVDHGSSQSLGSGTIVGSTESGKKLVITARHVVGGSESGRIRVSRRGSDYPARFLATAQDGDLAALESDVPGDIQPLRIASEHPSGATMLGFGERGTLHYHSGRLTGYATPRGDRSPDMAFSFRSDQGDSGGGVFNSDGELAGVVWGGSDRGAVAVSTAKLHAFLGARTQSQNGKRIVTISPFFIKIRREWSNAAPVVVQNPTPAQPNPAPAQVPGETGPAGPVGPQGPPGPAGSAADLGPLTARMDAAEAALKQQAGQIKSLADAQSAANTALNKLASTPITFITPNPDGSQNTVEKKLGETLTISPLIVPQTPAPK